MVEYRKNITANIGKSLSSAHLLEFVLTAPKLN